MIRIEFIFSRFKSILLGASGEGFRKQTKEGKSLFTLRGLVSCDANKTSSELPLVVYGCLKTIDDSLSLNLNQCHYPFITYLSTVHGLWTVLR